MSASMGLILGLGLVAFMIKTLAEDFEQKKDQMHKSLLAFAVFFIIGMEYTAIGIASANGFANAQAAYQFSLVVTVLVFFGMIYRIYQQVKSEAQNSSSMRSMGS